MENCVDKGSLTSSSGENLDVNNRNNLKAEAENNEVLATQVDKEIDNNCSITVKKEHEELLQNDSIENRIITVPQIKVEPTWGQHDIEHISINSFAYGEDKLEKKFLVQVDAETKVSEEHKDHIPKDNCTRQAERAIKTENCEIEDKPDFVWEEWKIKQEEIDLKEEGCESNKTGVSSGGTSPEKINKCHVCEYRTNKKYNFNRHLLQHQHPDEATLKRFFTTINRKSLKDGINVFQCKRCAFKTIQKNCLTTHISLHKEKCGHCKYASYRKNDLKRHMLEHKASEEGNTFECTQCEYKTTAKSYLKKHILVHRDPKEVNEFRCDKCDFKTIHKRSLKVHYWRHRDLSEVDTFKCSKCEFKTTAKSYLKKHLLVHKDPEEVNVFRCDKCDFKTIYKQSLKTHLLQLSDRTEIDLFKCEECEYQSFRKSDIKKHMLRHKNLEEVESFQCVHCEYRTIQKSSLLRHLVVHQDPQEVNMFRCDKCDFKSIHKRSLTVHISLHEGHASGKTKELFK